MHVKYHIPYRFLSRVYLLSVLNTLSRSQVKLNGEECAARMSSLVKVGRTPSLIQVTVNGLRVARVVTPLIYCETRLVAG